MKGIDGRLPTHRRVPLVECRGLAGSARGLVSTTAARSAAQLREAGCGGERRWDHEGISLVHPHWCTAVSFVAAVRAGAGKCPPDSVKVGNVCIDTYEASVWQIAPSNTSLVKLVQAGKATLAKLTAGGATLL